MALTTILLACSCSYGSAASPTGGGGGCGAGGRPQAVRSRQHAARPRVSAGAARQRDTSPRTERRWSRVSNLSSLKASTPCVSQELVGRIRPSIDDPTPGPQGCRVLTQGVLCRRYAGLAEAQAAWAVQVQAQQTWLMQLQAQSKLLQAHSAPPVSLWTWFDPVPCTNPLLKKVYKDCLISFSKCSSSESSCPACSDASAACLRQCIW